MRCFLCSAAVIVGVIGGGFVPARAAALPLAGLSGQKAERSSTPGLRLRPTCVWRLCRSTGPASRGLPISGG